MIASGVETMGDSDSIECPWCGHDIRDLGDALEPGLVIDCESCGRKVEIYDVWTTTTVCARQRTEAPLEEDSRTPNGA